MNPQDIAFDEDDQNLFQVDDIQLKAEALRHSVLPKLQAACNHLVDLIRDVYAIEVLEDSSFTLSPHFRTHGRIVELKKDYTEASIEISGQRKEGKWPGLAKPDGTPVTIVPFGMSFSLDGGGIDTNLYLSRPTYTKETFKKFFDFAHRYEGEIMAIAHRAQFDYWTPVCMDHLPPISTFSEILQWSYDKNINQIHLTGDHAEYPLDNNKVLRKLIDLVFAFPIYDSFMQISKGQPERFRPLLKKLNDTIWEMDVDQLVEEYEERQRNKSNDEALIEQARESAGKRIKVMPSMRWQVFQRDNWKCVACGKSADDEIWLEVDHILPRSKGGKNEINNYQTLCNVCNIGKSNKNDTDIRNSRKTLKP